MMTQRGNFTYTSDNEKGFKCIEIPYRQLDFGMLIILPDERFGLKNVIEKLDAKIIENLKNNEGFSEKQVLLKMPKFKIEYKASLNENLRLLGIEDAFDEENADFSAMSMQSKELYVSEVVHKAFVETSEEGTEAAAATGIKINEKCKKETVQNSVPGLPVVYPFVYIVVYKNQTLFMGKVSSF